MEITTRNGKCYLREICLEDIAHQFGTPFYLYDLNNIYEKIQTIRDYFGDSIKLYYAIKANSNLELLKSIRAKVDGLDISSYGEMEQCLLAGYSPRQLSFAGPGKTYGELEKAINGKIGIISVESVREMEDIKKVSLSINEKVDIALRINPSLLIKEFAIKMGGQATQFGIDEEKLDSAVVYLRENESHLSFKGIHVYSGTQCLNEEALVKNVDNVLEIAKRLKNEYDLECAWINLGGGFGVSYHDNQKLDIGKIAGGVKKGIENYKKFTKGNPDFVFELGRYLVTEAGIYVAKVVSHKESRGKLYFILDGGMNHHLAASGNFGQILKKNFMVKNLSNPSDKPVNCNLVGPLCTTLDILGRDIAVESPRVGDIIAFLNSGSYGFTSSPLLFLGHETPTELLLQENGIKIIRSKRKLIDFN
ncbi:MAG: pyridoxal-dependent decarboxylase, exosortase A system-associated [Thermodesulfobacteriota bacterium]|jgi:diaminopimelate decarboxylase